MEKKVIVKTEKKKPDSLKQPIKIAFIVTPDEPNGPSHPYRPVSPFIKAFSANSKESTFIRWTSQFQIALYSVRGNEIWTKAPVTYPASGQVVTLSSPTTWESPVLHDGEVTGQRSSVLVVNKSGSSQNIAMARPLWQIAYHPLEDGCSITLPSSWKLQAYVVDSSVNDRTILQPEDLTYPIFPVPILWDKLPAESTWTLSEDSNGRFHIRNDENLSIETVAEIASKKDPLSEILERLAVMEGSINRIQYDVAMGQRAIDNIHSQLSETKGEVQESRRSVAAIEGKTALLTSSFGQSQDHLAGVRNAVAGTQALLIRMQSSAHNRFSALEESADAARKYFATVDSSGIETKMEELERSVQEQLRGMERRMPAVDKLDKLETDLSAVQESVAYLNRRMGPMEETGPGEGEAQAGDASPKTTTVTFPSYLL